MGVESYTPGKTAFLFPGLLPFVCDEAAALLRTNPEVVDPLTELDRVIRDMLGWSIWPYWLGRHAGKVIVDCRTCYPLTLSRQIVSTALLVERGISPDIVMGISAGEPAAAVAAGCLDVTEALTIAAQTGDALERHQAWQRMRVVRSSSDMVCGISREMGGQADVAITIGAELSVVVGEISEIGRLSAMFDREGIRHEPVPFGFGAHNPHMNEVAGFLGRMFQHFNVRMPRCRFLSGAVGEWIDTARELKADYWVNHATGPIRFDKAFENLLSAGAERFIEVGPRSLFSGALSRRGLTCETADDVLRDIRRSAISRQGSGVRV